MRILIAEDDFASRILLDAVLVKWGYEVVPANDDEAAWDILRADNAPSIAIVDWMMPKLSGLKLCERVRQQRRELVPYVLMLTAKGQKSDVAQGLDAGADDYLVKPFDLAELAARLRVARRSIALQRELFASRRAVEYQALHDLSTGALNRGAALNALSEALAAGKPLSVLLLSLDGHKALQQREGAASAEAAMRALVHAMRSEAPDAAIGRYGADELLLLAPGASLQSALDLAERLRRLVAEPAFGRGAGLDSTVTTSVGVSAWDGHAGLELLLCHADAALHAARASGNAVDVSGFDTSPSQREELRP